MKKNASIIVAAGKGERMGGLVPKPYNSASGIAPLLSAARTLAPYGPLQVVIGASHRAHYKAAIAAGSDLPFLSPVEGGKTRAASVLAGLKALASYAPDFVLIHDGARPFIPRSCVDDLLHALEEGFDGAAPALPLNDNLKEVEGEQVRQVPMASGQLHRIQTPQAFTYQTLMAAFASATLDERDDLAVLEKMNGRVKLTQGDNRNIKLTHPDDWNAIGYREYRTGQGVDSHRFGAGDFITLGGLKIPHTHGIDAHSDGDVVLHALCDALLGAMADGDIGGHFPNTSEWKNQPSTKMLKIVLNRLNNNNYTIGNVDITIICQAPKIAPHHSAMRQSLARLLTMPLPAISIKATTTDRLGLIGEGKGLAVMASVLLRENKND